MPRIRRSSPPEDVIPNVVKVLKLILLATKPKNKNSKPFRDIYSDIAAKVCQPQFARTIGKQCVELTNNALCGHRYNEAAKLLWILYQDRSVFDIFIFRASMLVLENLEICKREDAVWTFVNDIQNLELINKKEVQLEYLIHGLIRGTPEIDGKVKALINARRKGYLRKNPLLNPILEGYLVYRDCIKLYLSESNTEMSNLKWKAKQIILKMNSLINVPGDWDIFVLKLVELLNRFDPEKDEESSEQKKSDEEKVTINSVLSKYVEKNPDNLNAHIYLSLYLNEREPTSPELIHHLEKISEMSPSDERVLILIQKLEILDKKLEKCFMFLDYPSNRNNQIAWNILLGCLYDAKGRNDKQALHTIETCWTSRRKSWYWMHFNPEQVSCLKDTEIIRQLKVKVLLELDRGHEFIRKVIEKFPTLYELVTYSS